MAFAATERNRGAAVDGNVFIRMPPTRRIAFAAGVLFIITFVTSIPALYLYQPVLDNPAGYIAGAGANNRIFLGASLELLLIIANVGTAVVLFPILRRQNEILALGFVLLYRAQETHERGRR